MKKYLYTILILILLITKTVSAAPISVPSASGSGYYWVSTTTGAAISTSTTNMYIGSLYASSTTASNYIFGKLFLPSLSQGYSYIGSNGLLQTVSTSTLAGQVFPFTSATGYNSTSTVVAFLNGLFSTASSTFTAPVYITQETAGAISIGSSTPFGLFSINPTTNLNNRPSFIIGSSSGTTFLVTGAGNVAIGVSPSSGQVNSYKLGVGGSASIGGSLGISGGFGFGNHGDFTFTDSNLNLNYAVTGNTISGSPFATRSVTFNMPGWFGIGTTTPRYLLNIASSTAPQIGLTGGISDNVWVMRNAGGYFYLATSSPLTLATSSVSAFTIDPNGKVIANCFSNDGSTCITNSAGSGSFPFSIDTNFSQLVYSTSTPTLWFKSGVFASSTSYLKQLITGDGTGKATTTIENLGGVLDATAFAGSDIGAKINAAYAALPSSGGIINVPSGTYSFTTAIQFTTSGKRVLLSCAPGRSTTLNYTGTATSTVWNTTVANTNSVGDGIENCYLKGSDTTSSNALVGIELGGTNGAEGFVMRGTEVRGFGKGITLGDNTYNVDFNNVMLRINGRNFVNECVNNCGEMIRFTNSLFADTQYNGVSTDVRYCMDFTGDLATVELINSSFDDCQVYVGAGVLRMNINGGHFENPGYAGISNYDYISIATSSYNYVNVTGSMFMNSSPTPAPEFIYNGGTLQASDVTLVASGSGTALTNFVKTSNSGTGGTVQLNRIANHYNTAFGVANMVDGQYASTGSAPAILDFLSVKNHSWAGIINQDTSNNLNFYEGGSLRARIDVNGYLGIASTTPTQLLSIGSGNRGTFAVSTTTDGCWQSTKGLAWIGSCLTGSSGAPAFTPTSYGASTSTVIGFTSGLFSLSSTTINGLKLSDLSQGFSYIGSAGKVNSLSTSTLATQIFNATTFSPNSIITTNSAGNLMATGTQLTVGNLLATSTTATSTFMGNTSLGTQAQVGIDTYLNELNSVSNIFPRNGELDVWGNLITFNGGVIGGSFLGTLDTTDGSNALKFREISDLTSDRNLDFATGDASRVITINGDTTLDNWFDQSVKTTANPTFAKISTPYSSSTAYSSFLTSSTTNGYFGTAYIPSLGSPAGSFLAVDASGRIIGTTTPTGGGGGVTSVTATYPMISSGGTTPNITIAFSTTTANIWSALNTFNGGLTIGTTTAGILRTNASGVVYASSASTTISLFNGFTNTDSTCSTTACSSIQPARVNAPAGTYGGMVYIASSTSAKTGFYGSIDIPDNFASSSAQVKVNWTATSTASGNVVFDFDYRCVGGDNTTSLYSATFQESTTTTVANPTTGGFRKNTTLNINAGYYCSAGDTMEFFLARDGADGADTGNVDTEIYNAVIKFLTQ